VLADDHPSLRSAIRTDLEDMGIDVCAEAEDAEGAIEAALGAAPDLCVIDLRMPGDGLVATWEITERLPATRVLILTVSSDPEDMLGAWRAGASGYLGKETTAALLAERIFEILDGREPLPPQVARQILGLLSSAPGRRFRLGRGTHPMDLEPDERALLEIIADGHSVSEAARTLQIEEATAEALISVLRRKIRFPHLDLLIAEHGAR
jgi:DNA-binding NarL/FixJ family response regulator